MQKRIIRTIHYAKRNDHTSKLFKSQNSLKIRDINKLEKCKIIHQIYNHRTPDELNKFNIKVKYNKVIFKYI